MARQSSCPLLMLRITSSGTAVRSIRVDKKDLRASVRESGCHLKIVKRAPRKLTRAEGAKHHQNQRTCNTERKKKSNRRDRKQPPPQDPVDLTSMPIEKLVPLLAALQTLSIDKDTWRTRCTWLIKYQCRPIGCHCIVSPPRAQPYHNQ